MANNRTPTFSENYTDEFIAFMQWLRKQYGPFASLSVTPDNFQGMEQYRYWRRVVIGDPQYGGTPSAEKSTLWPEESVSPPIPTSPSTSGVSAGILRGTPGTTNVIKNYRGSGYDYEVVFDKDGNGTVLNRIGQSEKPNDLGWAQLEQNRLQWNAQDFNTRQQQAISTEENRQAGIANQWQRYANQFQKTEDQIVATERRKMAQQYETWRNTLLGELTGSRDWITKWQVGSKPNPYALKSFSPGVEAKLNLEQAKKEEKNADLSLKAWQARKDDNADIIPPQLMRAAEDRYETALRNTKRAEQQFDVWKASEDYQKAQPRPTGEGATWQRDPNQPEGTVNPTGTWVGGNFIIGSGTSKNKPTGPAVPYWMPSFVPQTAGQATLTPKMKYEVAPPSGQQWNATPTSVKQGLAGYMDFAGQDYTDTLNQMQMRQTETPNIASGWKPSRQR